MYIRIQLRENDVVDNEAKNMFILDRCVDILLCQSGRSIFQHQPKSKYTDLYT